MSWPVLRQPTRRERLVFRLTKFWPDSYVQARLAYADALERALSLDFQLYGHAFLDVNGQRIDPRFVCIVDASAGLKDE